MASESEVVAWRKNEMLKGSFLRRRLKGSALVVSTGLLLSSVCSVADVRHNVLAGAMDFIESYTVGLLEALIPAPDELVGAEDE